eukprot:8105505-Karenia_brevis.AAC.1
MYGSSCKVNLYCTPWAVPPFLQASSMHKLNHEHAHTLKHKHHQNHVETLMVRPGFMESYHFQNHTYPIDLPAQDVIELQDL